MEAGATPMLKIGQGFGTWLIPIIIFGILGFVAVVSLVVLVWAYSCRSRRKTTDQEPETTHEIYRTPTIPYKNPSSDRPVDPTIGRLVTHSRSLHVPRNQMINAHRLRPQVSSPELRNASQPPPYPYRTTPTRLPRRNPRPQGQVYFDQIVDPGHARPIVRQQSQQLPLSPENLPTRPERRFSASSPSCYSSSCISMEENISTKAFSLPSVPSNFSQESFPSTRTLSWVVFPGAHRDSDSDSDGQSPPNELSVISILPYYRENKVIPSARPRHKSEACSRTERSRQNNRRLIIVDDNLVGRDSGVPSDAFKAHTLRQTEVTRSTKEKPSYVGNKNDRDAIFKVTCPDTGDLWKIPAIREETLDGFAGRVKQRTGGDVILFMNDEILASEEDWKAVKGGGRIVAHLIR